MWIEMIGHASADAPTKGLATNVFEAGSFAEHRSEYVNLLVARFLTGVFVKNTG